MTTFELKDLVGRFKVAANVDMKTSLGSAKIELDGLSPVLDHLPECVDSLA